MSKIAIILFLTFAFDIFSGVTAQTAKSDPLNKLKEPEMVAVEGGTYTMGLIRDEAGRGFGTTTATHVVTLSNFLIGKYEVTQAEWQAVMGDSLNFSLHAGCGNCPVEEVSWNEVQQFIQKLNNITGRFYQLPTQAQWEFAARGGKKSRGYKYAGSDNIDEVALLGGAFTGHTQPVGSKRPNELGIYDMTGNVAEWCQDRFNPDQHRPGAERDLRRHPSGYGYNIRGGSWGIHAEECQIANDGRMAYPNDRSAKVGFRLVLIPYIAQEKCFQGDTLQYIKCIEGRRSHYIGKPFNFLLNDLELPFKSFFNGRLSFPTDTGRVTTFAFYDIQTTTAILADLREHRQRQDFNKIVFLSIKWKTPLPPDTVESLRRSSGGKWTPAVQDYFGKQIIEDMISSRFVYVGESLQH
jgi:formylglycine-generating enzyme required for sulfatase activity